MIKTLGQRIRELREQKDLSLREFAKQLGGLSAPFLSDIELNRRYPSEEVLAKMAKVLGTSIEDLKSYDTRPPVQDLKRLATENPAYGLAFRKIIEKKVTPQELINLAERKRDPGKK
ncbi:MAG: helix-turn-helix transcriptional regulator [Chloroflexi bacterium]|nr:helix-turn-helix transcriptional regulator [Chloroflexota bacterium]MBE3119401.1 helix-turn-helix transcriptional regulator [Candidatus Atribacteria bacterium]